MAVSAVEEIERAIAKLTEERKEADYGEINGWLYEMPDDTRGYRGGPDDDPRTPITNDPVIVTLYRTIDAQIAILEDLLVEAKEGDEVLRGSVHMDDFIGSTSAAQAALVRAINGPTS